MQPFVASCGVVFRLSIMRQLPNYFICRKISIYQAFVSSGPPASAFYSVPVLSGVSLINPLRKHRPQLCIPLHQLRIMLRERLKYLLYCYLSGSQSAFLSFRISRVCRRILFQVSAPHFSRAIWDGYTFSGENPSTLKINKMRG